jgi:hypothetical protein
MHSEEQALPGWFDLAARGAKHARHDAQEREWTGPPLTLWGKVQYK